MKTSFIPFTPKKKKRKPHLRDTENYRTKITRQLQLYKTLISIFSWSHVGCCPSATRTYYGYNPISQIS